MTSPLPMMDINTDFDHYPEAVQEAIEALKTQYELEDGELEAVVNKLWEEDPSLGYSSASGSYDPTLGYPAGYNYPDNNVLSPQEAYITLPRSDSYYS